MSEIHSKKHRPGDMNKAPGKLYSYPKYQAEYFGTAPYLPMSREEMDKLGWDSCDIIIVTAYAYAYAYVDHSSFGMAVIGRLLWRLHIPFNYRA